MKLVTKLLLLAVLPLSALAAKLDLATHDSLIQKLESAVGAESSDAMLLQTNMSHRLADLYAERARLKSMDQQGQGDKIYAKAIASDREKAMAILSKIIPSLRKIEQGSALLQKAHLHIMQNQNAEALKIFRQIEHHASSFDAKSVTIVRIQLGDLAFQQEKFDEAKSQFQKAIQITENPRRGYSLFRLAWIDYNQGKSAQAEKKLTELLRNTKLFMTNDNNVDTSFQEEALHDLALFMAMNDITGHSLKTLSDLSPISVRKKNLIFLASELDRTAKKQSALKVWKIVGENETSFEEQLERQIQVTRIEYDLGHKESLLTEIERAIVLLLRPQCISNAECTVANQNLRRIITDWAKAEEREPSMTLISAFQKYTISFTDYEMNYWAAQASEKLQQHRLAYKFNDQAALLLATFKTKNEVQSKMFEGSLLGAIENAELAKDPVLKLAAYKHYLELNPAGAKRSEVKYQIAHTAYDNNNFAKAALEFRQLILDKSMPENLREKAADLTLDCLVLLKNYNSLETESLEYSKLLPSKKSEYLSIYQKAIFNQTAKVLNGVNSKAAYENELKKLNSLVPKNFTTEEYKLLIKNKMELSYRLNNMEMLAQNALTLLAVKKISMAEKEVALRHLIWCAELKMNFKEALRYLAQIQPAKNQMEDYLLKTATLQELAALDPSKAYKGLLAISKNNKRKAFAAFQIVLHAKNPLRSFKENESFLVKDTVLFSAAGIFAFEKSGDKKLALQLLSSKAVRQTFNGQLLMHAKEIEELASEVIDISKVHLKGRSDSRLKKTLVKRTDKLSHLENLANQAIKIKDPTMQLIYLAQVVIENFRLAEEIMNLPAPASLNSEQRKSYVAQVQMLVLPFTRKAQTVKLRTEQIWQDAVSKSTFAQLGECLETTAKPGCRVAVKEIAALRLAAKSVGVEVDPFEKLSEQRHKTLVESNSLKEKIRSNPFNMSDLAKLKTIQITLGHGPMVAYLDQRLTELQTKQVHNAN